LYVYTPPTAAIVPDFVNRRNAAQFACLSAVGVVLRIAKP
jgi:hypothetical protein